MYGNAAEWCADFSQEPPILTGVIDDPAGPPTGEYHVLLGTTFANRGGYQRGHGPPSASMYSWGMRVICEIDPSPQLPGRQK